MFGKALFLTVLLFFIFKIIGERGYKKLPWFFAGLLLFPPAAGFSYLQYTDWITYVLLILALVQKKGLRRLLKGFPLKVTITLLFVSLVVIGIFDIRLPFALKLYRPISYFITSFFVIVLTFNYIKTIENGKRVFQKLIYLLFFFCIYGISNYITRRNPYYSFVVQSFGGRDFVGDNMANAVERFRIASFGWHAIFYGFLLAVVILLEIFLLTSRELSKRKRKFYILALLLLLINLVMVNSRTPLLSLVAGFSVYSIFGMNFRKKIKLLFYLTAIGATIYLIAPGASQILETTVNTFGAKGSNVEGSSVEMRDAQLAGSVFIFYKNPVLGNGFNYITENLGYSSDPSKRTSDEALAGFESYVFKLLIEQGLCGIVGNLIFFISLFVWLIKSYKYVDQFAQKTIVLSASVLVTFILFIIGTGDLGTFPFAMAFLGVSMKLIVLSKRDKNYKTSKLSTVSLEKYNESR